MKIKQQIATAIKARREELKLNKRQFAEKIDINFQHLPNIENGVTNLTVKSVDKIFDALDLEILIKTKA